MSDQPAALSPEHAARRLRDHPAWVVERNRLHRDIRFADFNSAIAFIDRVAEVAETLGHHPNIRLHEWCFVELETYSHVTGGLTDSDVQLARALDALIS